MSPRTRIDEVVDRRRLNDLSFSLYECLGDLLVDMVALDDATDKETANIEDRITLSGMNCLADIRMLLPMFDALVRLRG